MNKKKRQRRVQEFLFLDEPTPTALFLKLNRLSRQGWRTEITDVHHTEFFRSCTAVVSWRRVMPRFSISYTGKGN